MGYFYIKNTALLNIDGCSIKLPLVISSMEFSSLIGSSNKYK